jgi:protein ImuB
LGTMCIRLQKEENGLRTAILKAYRVDGKIEKIELGVNRPTSDAVHLFKLFELKINTIEPSLGIELFTLEALKVEENKSEQEECWKNGGILTDNGIARLIDRMAIKIGEQHIHRYLPDEHYLPERSVKKTLLLEEAPAFQWKDNQPRPVQVLMPPEPIMVTAPIPDYPPMMFRYKNKIHKIIKADGPERIEQEWWIKEGRHRDYYYVEDEEGCRYWLFRSGFYDGGNSDRWFLHGYCA